MAPLKESTSSDFIFWYLDFEENKFTFLTLGFFNNKMKGIDFHSF